MTYDGARVPPKREEDRQAQALRAASRQAERGMSVAASGQIELEAREEESEPVRSPQKPEGPLIDAESRGAHSFDLEKKERKEEREKPADPGKIDDPEGRGVKLDVKL